VIPGLSRTIERCAIALLALCVASSPATALNRWESFGPPGFHALTSTGVPPLSKGSDVKSIAVDPGDGTHLYAATSDGLFVSRDAGTSWTFANANATSFDQLGMGKIVVDPSNPSILYVVSCCGLLKSTDGGTTLTPTSLTAGVHDFALDPAAPANLYALTTAGVLRTTDGGATWSGGPSPTPNQFTIAVGRASAAYVATPTGVLKSVDGGRSFQATALTAPSFLVATPRRISLRSCMRAPRGAGSSEWT